jgi:hypothetical protein
MRKIMNKLMAAVFLLLGLLLTAPAAGLSWLMLQGNTIGMAPGFGLIVIGMALAGVGTVAWMILRLIGRDPFA